MVCRKCLEKVQAWQDSCCPSCGRFFEGAVESHFCGRCLEMKPSFSFHRSCGRYDGILKDLILLFKYRGYKVLGNELGDFMARTLGEEEGLWRDVDGFIAVPLHPRREKKRGYNQALILAEYLGRARGLEVIRGRLVKVRNVPPQSGMKAEEREQNVMGAFEVRKGEDLEGKVIALVDDVYTTGSTLRECSVALRRAGAKEIRAVTAAQA